MEELEQLRNQIDEIDRQMVENFEKRMELVSKIGYIKKKSGIRIYDPKREEKVVEKAISNLKNKDLIQEVEVFIKTVMDLSKKIQERELKTE